MPHGMTEVSLLVTFLLLVTPPWDCHAQRQQQVRTVTVSTPLGDVTGRVTAVLDRDVHQFLGVPYARPPLGQLRFSKPEPVQPWSPTTLNATQMGASCPQPGSRVGTSEDCLYLNIYALSNDSVTDGLRPVMVWIHGGGFEVGSGSGTDGSLMALRGRVVVVTLNYRLGMLGWLSTLDAHCPGNNGLWDQKMALHWVKDNIAAFGGDPNQTTLFGQSAGGYSAGLHAVAPLNNGLFQRAVMQSGTALNRRTIALDPRGFAERFANNLGCLRRTGETSGFDTRYFVDCARQKSVAQIVSATSAASRRQQVAWILDVAPVIDGELIPADVRTLLLDPRYRDRVPFWTIDLMVGTTSAEGSLVVSPLTPFQRALEFNLSNGIPTRVLCSNVTRALARDYLLGSLRAAEAMCGQYASRTGDADQARQVVDLYGDMMFVAPAVETLLLHANGSLPGRQVSAGGRSRSSFLYLFSHTPRGQGLPYQWFRGAGHGAEVNFVFGQFVRDQEEATLALAMIDGWTNFAKYGTPNDPQKQLPTLTWPSYDPTTRAFANLDLVLSSQADMYGERMRFWLQTIAQLNTETPRSTPRATPQLPAVTSVPRADVIVPRADVTVTSPAAGWTGRSVKGSGAGYPLLQVGAGNTTAVWPLPLMPPPRRSTSGGTTVSGSRRAVLLMAALVMPVAVVFLLG